MYALILIALTLLAGAILAPLLIHLAYRAPRARGMELLLLPDTGHDSRKAIITHGGSLMAFLRRSGAGSTKPLA